MDIDLLAAAVQEWTVEEYVQTTFYAAFTWWCITTFDEEVNKIWSQIHKLGSVLYMITKYSMIGHMVLDMVVNFRLRMDISHQACESMITALRLLFRIAVGSAEASLLLCLYALLGAKKKYLVVLGVAFMAYFIGIILCAVMLIEPMKPEPLTDFDRELGYSCPLAGMLLNNGWWTAGTFLNLVVTSLTAIFATLTLFVRYRRHRGKLIRVIRRDGAIYYTVVILFQLLSAIQSVPGAVLLDKYHVVDAALRLLMPVCANTLIINMRKIGDGDATRMNVVTTLLFAGTPEAKSFDVAGESVELDSAGRWSKATKDSSEPGP